MKTIKICPICRKPITKRQEEYTVDVWNGTPDEAYEAFFHEYCVYKKLIEIAEDYARDMEMMEE